MTAVKIVERVALDQAMRVLDRSVQPWAFQADPQRVSMVAVGLSQAESTLFRMLVQVEGRDIWALVDTGSELTIVAAKVVPPSADKVLPPVRVVCVHGDVEECPRVNLPLTIQGRPIKVVAAVTSRPPNYVA